jgi:hypothetical protein
LSLEWLMRAHLVFVGDQAYQQARMVTLARASMRWVGRLLRITTVVEADLRLETGCF